MKKVTLSVILATATAMAMDFSQMSTETLINMRGTLSSADRPAFRAEMQKRMQTMTADERQRFMQNKPGAGGMGKGMMGQRANMGQRGNRGRGMQSRPTFASYDFNKDGKITQKEFQEAQAARMSEKANEGRMMKNASKAPTFESIDTNKNGTISQDEFSKHQISRMNQNRQGKVRGQGSK